MRDRWSEAEANEFVQRYAEGGVSLDLALRIYSSRLIGAERALVLHGGGNTSLKTRLPDVFGAETEVICVKGSGWDLDTIEPAGLPAMRLKPLRALRSMRTLSDEQMVNEQRSALLNASAPNPSVETLLHAWLPHKFIDHTHANAILALTDQADGATICRDLYGTRLVIAPYCMPGFSLAHVAVETFERNPDSSGMILLNHGIFTWGGSARESYERMITFVDIAERRIATTRIQSRSIASPPKPSAVADVAPRLRGSLMRQPGAKRWILEWRASSDVLSYISGEKVARYSQAGVVTPDHVIRTKPWPLLLTESPDAQSIDDAVRSYMHKYQAYFDRWNALSAIKKKPLDPLPRVVLVPGVGLFGVGQSKSEAKIAADIAETAISVIAAAEGVGQFQSISEREIFEMEYWSLEQAKLGKSTSKSLAGSVVAITGGGGAIGAATACAFEAQGASVIVLDVDERAAKAAAKLCNGEAIVCDVTSQRSVDHAFFEIARSFGGLDVLVSNAGAAWQGEIGSVDESVVRQSMELNFYGHQRVAQAAVGIMRLQRAGGCLLFNVSKQALNPGAAFGPYGVAKAATLFLARQYAVDHGKEGIRSNVVNADRIRSGLLSAGLIAERSAARGLSQSEYMSGNLLQREVTAADVANAFVTLAMAETTTGAILNVDGGNIAAAPR